MQFLTRFSLKNPAAIIIICLLLMAGGGYSFSVLKSDLLPDIEFPQLSITAVYPGASAPDIDEQVTKPLEAQLSGVTGVTDLTSQSLENVGRIQMTFPIGTDMDKVVQQANDLANKATLPDNVEVKVDRFSFGAFPIIIAAVFGEDGKNIDELALKEIKPALQKVEGVQSVALSGTPTSYLQITLNKAASSPLGISTAAVKQALTDAKFSFPAGTVQTDDVIVPVRVEQTLTTKEQLKNVMVTSPITQQMVPLSQVATLEEISDRKELSRFNLNNSLSLLINKKQTANTVEVSDRVFEVLNKYDDQINYELSFDQSAGIKASVSGLIKDGLLGALFASLAVLIFLRNFRATLIAVVSIPLSILIAAIFIRWYGITLNIMSLAGMAVAVGRVVDDSIIVIENIYRKMRLQPNADRTLMTIEGTKEMINPIISSTLVSIVVFMPLALVGGITGAFFYPFAITIVVALLASLIVAVTLIPVLARFSFKKLKDEAEKEPFYVGWYEKVARFALRKKWVVIVIAITLFFGSIAATSGLGFVFLPNEKQKIVQAEIVLPTATVIEATDEVTKQVEKKLIAEKDKYKKVFASIGNYDFATGTTLSNRAQFFVELDKDKIDPEDAIKEMNKMMTGIVSAKFPTGVVTVAELQGGGPPSNNNIDIDLFSSDLSKLEKAAAQVEQLMLKRDDLKYVKNNMAEKQDQWVVRLKYDQIKAYGLSPFMVFGVVSDVTRPVQAGRMTLDGVETELRLTYDRAIQNADEISNLMLFSAKGPVLLSQVADVKKEKAVTSIQKLDQRVYARVTAQITTNDTTGTSKEIEAAVAKLKLPAGVSLEAGGGGDETTQTLKDILVAIGAAIGLVFIVMLVFFGKARVPLIILTSLLFVPIGSLIGLYISKEPLSLSAMIGLLMLVGIVVTNAIVFIDRVNQNLAAGKLIDESLIEAGKTRLRPILMTAFATIAALLPLAVATPEGGLISRGLALVVIGGLTTSTILTLVFIPAIYELFFYRRVKAERQANAAK
jgi:HAE1 family hydrophobic/amphiphilic exporter-1